VKRRTFFTAAGAAATAPNVPAAPVARARMRVELEQYEPKSTLRVHESTVPKPRFPVIDVHTHLSFGPDFSREGKPKHLATSEAVLAVMDKKGIRTLVNLTGGAGSTLDATVAYWQKPHPDRFLVFVEPSYYRAAEPGYARFQAAELERAHRAGARGLKLTKMLGLYLRERVTEGPLVKVDDPRFDPMWEAAGALGMPVAIHTSDPEAFFLPIDRFNERFEELNAHPDWSFHGKDFPPSRELYEARNRVMARHPRTQFLLLHVGVAEDLGYMAQVLEKHPNAWVETAARIGELGRQPRAARKFIDRFQDRVLFGTDAIPGGTDTPQQVFGERLYEIYYRFLETEDEYFDYAPARVPPQGRWRISGLGLPEPVLRKIYHANAARLLMLS
jgi:predicted TIM-barrel fold metal-dependent hydrolase